MKYYKNKNNKVYAYETEESYEKFGKDLNLTKISNEERHKILNPPKTQEEKVNEIANLIISIHNTETKNTKYYFGWGFKNGIESLARHPNHPDALKLNNWIDESWNQASIWFKKITNNEVSIDYFTEDKIREILPNVNDF